MTCRENCDAVKRHGHEVCRRCTESIKKCRTKKRWVLLLSVIHAGRSMWCAGAEDTEEEEGRKKCISERRTKSATDARRETLMQAEKSSVAEQ
jgi:hypothetical protein